MGIEDLMSSYAVMPPMQMPMSDLNLIQTPAPGPIPMQIPITVQMPAYQATPTQSIFGGGYGFYDAPPVSNSSVPLAESSLNTPSPEVKGTYTYDQSTVDMLLKKYDKALGHVGDKAAFVKKLVGIAQKYNIDPNALIVMFYSEGGIDPKSKGGLFGCMPSTARRVLKMDINQFRGLSALQQLDCYETLLASQIKMCFKGNPPSKISGAILYAMNFTPGYVRDTINDPNHILVSANSSDPKKRAAFFANDGKGSLADGKSYISLETIQARLDRKEREIMKYFG